jgi:hypothetical protein
VDEPKISSSLSSISRASAVLIGVVYFAAFLTVTLHLARFGVSEFNLLRPHIFSAGALFALVCAIPIYSVLRLYGLVGPIQAKAPGGRPIEHVTLYTVELAAGFSVMCYWHAVLSGALVLSQPPHIFKDERGWAVLLTAMTLVAAIAVLSHFFFDKPRFVLAPASIVVSAIFVLSMIRYSESGVLRLFAWYYVVALLSVAGVHMVYHPPFRAGLQFELVPLWLLVLLYFYSWNVLR